jgi:hypothetical protein
MSMPNGSFGVDHRPHYAALAELSDEALMSHLAEGNHDALAAISDRYQRLVIRVTMQILRDQGEAEDAMQSVFIASLETARKFDAACGTGLEVAGSRASCGRGAEEDRQL